MKAYKVTDIQVEEIAEIVFAESRSKARAIAKGSEWFGEADYTDLRAVRVPDWDDLFEHCGPGRARFDDPVVLRRARGLGWHEYDASYQSCSRCGLFQWRDLPESELADLGEELVCAGCRSGEGVLA